MTEGVKGSYTCTRCIDLLELDRKLATPYTGLRMVWGGRQFYFLFWSKMPATRIKNEEAPSEMIPKGVGSVD